MEGKNVFYKNNQSLVVCIFLAVFYILAVCVAEYNKLHQLEIYGYFKNFFYFLLFNFRNNNLLIVITIKWI